MCGQPSPYPPPFANCAHGGGATRPAGDPPRRFSWIIPGCAAALALLACACCGTWFFFGRALDDLQAQWIANHLFNAPLPPDTEVLARHSGVLGQTSYCTYQAEMELATRLSRPEIEAYYLGLGAPPPAGVFAPGYRVDVSFDPAPAADGRLRATVRAWSEGECWRL